MTQFTKTLLVHSQEHPVHPLLHGASELCSLKERAHCKVTVLPRKGHSAIYVLNGRHVQPSSPAI